MSWITTVEGRLRNIKIDRADALAGVFEAVTNAVEAIEAAGGRGTVAIRILRDTKTPVMMAEGEVCGRHPLIGFEIEDDGIGFTDENFVSFKTPDSLYKADRGGKGIGRLLWLKMFERVQVESTFLGPKGHVSRTFHCTVKGGIEGGEPRRGAKPRRTVVRLQKPMEPFAGSLDMDLERFAEKVLDHFFVLFLTGADIRITLRDDGGGSELDLNAEFRSRTSNDYHPEEFEVNGRAFTAHHFTIAQRAKKRNTYALCAGRRAVADGAVSEIVPDLRGPVLDGPEPRWYRVYVTGSYLDEIVDQERTSLRFPKEDAIPFPGEVSKRELLSAVAALVRVEQASRLTEVRRAKEARIERFIGEKAPHFRPYLAASGRRLELLKPEPSEREIEEALYAAKIDGREEVQRFAVQLAMERKPYDQVQALVREFTTAANTLTHSALAEFVIARRAVLDVLETNLGVGETGAYPLEKVLHDLFFPRGTTSTNVEAGPRQLAAGERDMQNLWLLDERLVFHRLLASDLPLDQLNGFLAASDGGEKEPDITIFDPFFVSSDSAEIQNIALIEFKRPDRNDYAPGGKKNPIDQVIEAAEQLRAGSFRDRKGANRRFPETAIIYAYVICDITPSLEKIITQRDLTPSPDGRGHYYYHRTFKMMLEVISYEKLVIDARRRNAAFFEQLGLC